MNGHVLGLLLVVAAALAESLAHVAFKAFAHVSEPGLKGLLRAGARRWDLVGAGMALFILNVACWTLALRAVDLSVAQPMSSIGLLLTLGLSRISLRESLGTRRWIGALLITAGVIAVGVSR